MERHITLTLKRKNMRVSGLMGSGVDEALNMIEMVLWYIRGSG